MKTYRIDTVPAPRLMRTIGATALSPMAAVAELVANALDARLDECPVHIEIRLSDGRIEVVDDAGGMSLNVLGDALRLGVDMDDHIEGRSGRMGTYGLGMKTAAASLGDRWGIVTRPASETPVEYSVNFDLQDWASRDASADEWTIELQEREPNKQGPLGAARNGTVIWIENLRFKDHLPGAYLDHLSRAFAPFIKHGNTIRVNGQPAITYAPSLADGTYKEFRTVVDEAQGWVLRGWVGLDSKTHNDGHYGIDLYRNNQLIEIHNKDFFKAHLMTSRIMGEAHLDFVPVNFNKVDFSKGTEEWKIAKASMTELLKPVVEASRTMSRGRHDDSRVTKAVAKLEEAFNGPTDFTSTEATGVGEATTEGSDAKPPEIGTPKLRASGRLLQLPQGAINIDAQLVDEFEDIIPWDYVYEGNALVVVLNSASPIFQKMKDVDFLACIAVADCISRFLIERMKVEPTKARRVSNEWLHEAVTGQPIWQLETAANQPSYAQS